MVRQRNEANNLVASKRRRVWKQENASALESSNRYVDDGGIPLTRYRQF